MSIQYSSTFSESGLKKIQVQIEMLRRDLGAVGALLFDLSGRLLIADGHHSDFDTNALLALLGNAMSAANAVVHLLHDEGGFDLHFHEGQNYEMYTSRISDQVFLTMIFDKRAGAGRVGMVWMTLRRAITELRTLTEQAHVEPGTAEDREIKSAVTQTLDEAISRLDHDLIAPSAAETKPTADLPPRPAPPPDARPIKPPHLSPSELDASEPTISFEEARRRGLINFDPLDDSART